MRTAGFTLIELMTVIALITILGVVGIGAYTQATVKSLDTERKNDVNQIVKALESFNSEVGRYPLSTDTEKYPHCYDKINGLVTDPTCTANKLTATIDGSSVQFIQMPSDPDPNKQYVYESSVDGSTFSLYMALENTSDKDLLKDGNGVVIADPFAVSCGSAPCNYKVTETGLVKSL